MMAFRFTLADEAATDRFGAVLARQLPDRAVVALVGPLGAGKTRLVQAVAAAVGIPRDQVTSPTFVCCHEYHGQRTIYHFDAFRLADEDAFRDLGPEEYFEEPALVFIEWADRIENCLPEDRLEIRIEPHASRREVTLIAHGPGLELVPKPLTPSPSPRKRGEGSQFWDRFLETIARQVAADCRSG